MHGEDNETQGAPKGNFQGICKTRVWGPGNICVCSYLSMWGWSSVKNVEAPGCWTVQCFSSLSLKLKALSVEGGRRMNSRILMLTSTIPEWSSLEKWRPTPLVCFLCLMCLMLKNVSWISARGCGWGEGPGEKRAGTSSSRNIGERIARVNDPWCEEMCYASMQSLRRGQWTIVKEEVIWTMVGLCLSSQSALTRRFFRFWGHL